MEPRDPFKRPSPLKTVLSFATGALVGVVFVSPMVRTDLVPDLLGDPGPVGNVVMIGVLAILVVSTGLFGLIRLFLLIDK